MTAEEHNRTLGIFHLIYGGLYALTFIGVGILFAFLATLPRSHRGGGDPFDDGVFFIIMMSMMFFWILFTIPSFIAGYGLLKRKKWAKIWSIISGVLAGMSFPLGTALCVYNFWFLFSEQGKALYDMPQQRYNPDRPGALYGAPQPSGWTTHEREREYTYAPPPQPPNWRDE